MFDAKKIKLFLFDMDGTIYLGNRLFEPTIPLLNTIKEQGNRYLFMTNNSSKSVEAYVEKLAKLGIAACKEDFMTSSQATSYFLKKNYADRLIFVSGTESFKKELRESGLNITDERQEGIGCIVCGFDTELTFKKLEDLSILLLDKDLPYFAANLDLVCPTEYGYVPDCGSVSEMLYNATGRRPIGIGKPSPLMVELAIDKWGVSKEETMLIGDRLYTDIACGKNAGIPTVLVLSGETDEQMAAESEHKADVIMQDIGVLLKELKA